MGIWWHNLDRILRGEATRAVELRRGMIGVPAGGLSVVIALLAMGYGACMGCFALLNGGGPAFEQVAASTLKMPALFFLTLAITLPSLYVFNALVGSQLSMRSVVRLLIASMAVMVAVLASLGPIVAFFSLSTTSHAFMVLLNVLVCGVSGVLGLAFLLQTLHRLSVARAERIDPTAGEPLEPIGEEKPGAWPAEEIPGALERAGDQVLGGHVKTIFRCWVVLFGLVGAQMSWVLRPLIGDPRAPFVWFGPRESNFFAAVWRAFTNLL